MRIKKHQSGNRYLLTPQGLWVRDFTRAAPFLDINRLTRPADHERLIRNHLANVARPGAVYFDPHSSQARSVVIVGDGHEFQKKLAVLGRVPKNVTVIGIGRSLARWEGDRPLDFYVANNPYDECLSYLSARPGGKPTCLASVRTCPDFVKKYRGRIELYHPAPEEGFDTRGAVTPVRIDDYRNPLCAALGLAHRMGATRILLLACDEAFPDDRPAAVRLENGLFTYPQQLTTHGLVEGFAYWYRRQDGISVAVGDHSSGPNYKEIEYITEEDVRDFFLKEL